MTDYCDTCKTIKEELSRNQAILNRSHQSGSATEDDIKSLEEKKRLLDTELAVHKEAAGKSRDHYNAIIKKTSEDWREITRLSSITSPTTIVTSSIHSSSPLQDFAESLQHRVKVFPFIEMLACLNVVGDDVML